MKTLDMTINSLLILVLLLLMYSQFITANFNYELIIEIALLTIVLLNILIFHIFEIKKCKKLNKELKEKTLSLNDLSQENEKLRIKNQKFSIQFTVKSLLKFVSPKLFSFDQSQDLNQLQNLCLSSQNSFLSLQNDLIRLKEDANKKNPIIDKLLGFMTMITNLINYYQLDPENIKTFYENSNINYDNLVFISNFIEIVLENLDIQISYPEILVSKFNETEMTTFPTLSPMNEIHSERVSPLLHAKFRDLPKNTIYYLLKLGYTFEGEKHKPVVLIK